MPTSKLQTKRQRDVEQLHLVYVGNFSSSSCMYCLPSSPFNLYLYRKSIVPTSQKYSASRCLDLIKHELAMDRHLPNMIKHPKGARVRNSSNTIRRNLGEDWGGVRISNFACSADHHFDLVCTVCVRSLLGCNPTNGELYLKRGSKVINRQYIVKYIQVGRKCDNADQC